MRLQAAQFLNREAPHSWRLVILLAGIAGVANAAILGIINTGAAAASSDLSNFRYLLLFAIAMLIYYTSKRVALVRSSQVVEEMLRDMLVRVGDKLRRSELSLVETLGKGEIYTKVTQNTSFVSESALILVNAAQESIMLVFCFLYIAWLSKAAFAVTVVSVGIAILIYFNQRKSLMQDLAQMTAKEAEMIDSLGHMIDGFKEIRLSRRKSNDLFRSFDQIAGKLQTLKLNTKIRFCSEIMFSDVFFYLLLAVIVFLLPRIVPTYAGVVLMTTAAILFIIGPLQMIVGAAPMFMRARVALNNLYELEDRLDQAAGRAVPSSRFPAPGRDEATRLAPWPTVEPGAAEDGFHRIAFDDVLFSYPAPNGSDAFAVGPINLEVRRGEMLFLVGGNGSGKTTLLKLLTGLYLPDRGALKVDGRPITRNNVDGYRELFTAVFADFHLFDRLYGLENVDEEKVTAVLAEMDLTDKTRYENGRFSNINLSTGQRKRLALAVSLLEDKEIFVFDEWAADQDPHFRKHFYEAVLPRLKADGKTIVAVTHDDRFWAVADRVVKMDYGEIIDEARHG